MHSISTPRKKGFSLIELMVTVAIIGIIAGIAYPSYLDSVRRANRADAKAAIMSNAQTLERCFSTNGTYENCGNLLTASEGNLYTIDTDIDSATTYTITATPIGTQADDTDCNSFTLDNLGIKGPQDSADNGCWR